MIPEVTLVQALGIGIREDLGIHCSCLSWLPSELASKCRNKQQIDKFNDLIKLYHIFLLAEFGELIYDFRNYSPKETTLGIKGLMGDQAILEEIGERLGRRRVELAFTQAELAEEAGISKRTVERVEAGESTQTSTLIRILRALQLLEALDAAIPATGPHPMDLLKLRGRERRRAPSKKRREQAGEEWSWGDET